MPENTANTTEAIAITGSNIKRRMAARLAAVQSLYAAQISDDSPIGQAAYTNEDGHQAATDTALRDALINAAEADRKTYDDMIDAQLDKRRPQSLELLLRLILRCGCAELITQQETDKAIVISAYVDIAKEFYDGKEPSLINAVLDKIAKTLQ